MLKVNIGWSQKRLAQLVAFGLSEGNLLRLPKDPIYIDGKDIDIEAKFEHVSNSVNNINTKTNFEHASISVVDIDIETNV